MFETNIDIFHVCFKRQTGQSAGILSWNKLATCRTSWIVWSTMYHVYSFKDYSKSCNTWEFDILWIKGYIYGFTSIFKWLLEKF